MSMENLILGITEAIKAMPGGTLSNAVGNLTEGQKQEFLDMYKGVMGQFLPNADNLIETIFPKILEEISKTDVGQGNVINNLMQMVDKISNSMGVNKSPLKPFSEYVKRYFAECKKYEDDPTNVCFIKVGSFYEAYSAVDHGPQNLGEIGEKLNIVLTNRYSSVMKDDSNPSILSFPVMMVDYYSEMLGKLGYDVIFLGDEEEISETVEVFECQNCLDKGAKEPMILQCGHTVCKKCVEGKLECNMCNENFTIYL
ncbi:MAG: hypothetical protein Hyperionvirus12_46 [Hyperionvirus sp.]|uniref:RING-type domain-containing protein n=1 Tax=Hyperionvirus sp. TaxID=2487770 RepID=A0A3G5AEQ2_9VIRU|nr:MAG: hypothetical protein Hyperionvirus12_46 [Hyperionvirus sp.]